jgi:hypothetical protein
MSEMSQGWGWWLASDGKWYPPEKHPDYRPPLPPPPPSDPLFVTMVPTMQAPPVSTQPSVTPPTPTPPSPLPPITNVMPEHPAAQPSANPVVAFPMENYDGGFAAHRRPESNGRIVLTAEAKWELHFDVPGKPGGSEWISGPLARFALELEEIGPTSCRVTIRDMLHPADHAGFRLPGTSADEVRAFIGDGERHPAVGEISNYNGGIHAHNKPEHSGILTMMPDGYWRLTFNGGQYVQGPIQRYPLDTNSTGASSCHVTIRDVQDPHLNASFDLPNTSVDELQRKISPYVHKSTAGPVSQPSPVSQQAQQTVVWWSGITPHVLLYNCHYAGARDRKEMGTLKVTESGIDYKGNHLGAAKVSLAWEDIAKIEIVEQQQQHGKQHSAIGIGPVGLAVVGATMLSNRRNAKVDVIRVVRLTTKQGKQGDFFLKDSAPRHLAPILEIIACMPK